MDYLKNKYYVELLENDTDFFTNELIDRLKNLDPSDIVFIQLILENFFDIIKTKKDKLRSQAVLDKFILSLHFVEPKILHKFKKDFFDIGVHFGKLLSDNIEWYNKLINVMNTRIQEIKSKDFYFLVNWFKFSEYIPIATTIENNPFFNKGNIPTRNSEIITKILKNESEIYYDTDPTKIVEMAFLLWFIKNDIIKKTRDDDIEDLQLLVQRNLLSFSKMKWSNNSLFFMKKLKKEILSDDVITDIHKGKIFDPPEKKSTRNDISHKFFYKTFKLLNGGYISINLLKYIYLFYNQVPNKVESYTQILYSIISNIEPNLVKLMGNYGSDIKLILDSIFKRELDYNFNNLLELDQQDLDLEIFKILMTVDEKFFSDYGKTSSLSESNFEQSIKKIQIYEINDFVLDKILESDPLKNDINMILESAIHENYSKKDTNNWIKNFNTYNILYKNRSRSIIYKNHMLSVSGLEPEDIIRRHPNLLLDYNGISFYIHDRMKSIGMLAPKEYKDLYFYINEKMRYFNNHNQILEHLMFDKEINIRLFLKYLVERFDINSMKLYSEFINKHRKIFDDLLIKKGRSKTEIITINDVI